MKCKKVMTLARWQNRNFLLLSLPRTLILTPLIDKNTFLRVWYSSREVPAYHWNKKSENKKSDHFIFIPRQPQFSAKRDTLCP